MDDVAKNLWPVARPWFRAHFAFWPDHEDLMWAKSIWPTFLDCGLFNDQNEEAEAWTQRNIQALSILYAQSARVFGTPDYSVPETFTRQWMHFRYGSEDNLDTALDEVGRAICFSFPENAAFVGDPDFFRPLIRSLVCGSGFHRDGVRLDSYLDRVAAGFFQEPCEFNEPALRRMWIGGHFASSDCDCLQER